MRALRKFLLSGDGGVKLLNSPGFLLGMSSREIYRDLKRMIDRVGPAMEHDLGGGKMLITFNIPITSFDRNLEILVKGKEFAAARRVAPRDAPDAWAVFVNGHAVVKYRATGAVIKNRYFGSDADSIEIGISPNNCRTFDQLLKNEGELKADYPASEILETEDFSLPLTEVAFPDRVKYQPHDRNWFKGSELLPANGKARIKIGEVVYYARHADGAELYAAVRQAGRMLSASFPLALPFEQASGIQAMMRTPGFEWMELLERYPVANNPKAGETPDEQQPLKLQPEGEPHVQDSFRKLH